MFYSLVVRGQIKAGNSILIHSGSGGVGQAAISVALHYGCKVFTTVGTPEKKDFLQEKFPELDDSCFFSSRDTTFELGIKRATSGKGNVRFSYLTEVLISFCTLTKLFEIDCYFGLQRCSDE